MLLFLLHLTHQTSRHFVKHLDIFNNEAETETAFNEFVGYRTSDFDQSEIMKLLSLWKIVSIVMVYFK
jgi:hypothetical protein